MQITYNKKTNKLNLSKKINKISMIYKYRMKLLLNFMNYQDKNMLF